MEDFLWIIQNCQLFSGISENEIKEMLICLDAKQKSYQKGDFIFRTGATTDAIGLLLNGTAFILQDDFWGNRNILSTVTPGQTFAETFACAPGTVMTVSVIAESNCDILLLDVKRILNVCSAAANSHFLRTAGPHFPDSPGHIKRTVWDISRAESTPPY